MHLLVIRFSAFGDVAMTVPVIMSVARQYPQHRFTILSRESMRPLFLQMPSNVAFYGVNLKDKRYKGFLGLIRLYKEVRRQVSFDVVADLHNVLRSQVLRLCAKVCGIKTGYINKGKSDKKRLTRARNKVLKPLLSSFERYADVFVQLGLPVEINFSSIYSGEEPDLSRIYNSVGIKKAGEFWVGIAPFAAHKGKIYPLDKMEQVVALLATEKNMRVFLFGAGDKEKEIMMQWAQLYPNVTLPIGIKMEDELILMSQLDVMVSMDSANMHLASLVGTSVLSIWGATHPYCGFMGYNQPLSNAIQIDELLCRPCSVFGNKPCLRKDYACFDRISPERVCQAVKQQLSKGV